MFDIKLVLERKQANKCTLEVIHIVKLIFFLVKLRESKLDEERKKGRQHHPAASFGAASSSALTSTTKKKRRKLLKVTLFGAWKSPFRIEIRG